MALDPQLKKQLVFTEDQVLNLRPETIGKLTPEQRAELPTELLGIEEPEWQLGLQPINETLVFYDDDLDELYRTSVIALCLPDDYNRSFYFAPGHVQLFKGYLVGATQEKMTGICLCHFKLMVANGVIRWIPLFVVTDCKWWVRFWQRNFFARQYVIPKMVPLLQKLVDGLPKEIAETGPAIIVTGQLTKAHFKISEQDQQLKQTQRHFFDLRRAVAHAVKDWLYLKATFLETKLLPFNISKRVVIAMFIVAMIGLGLYYFWTMGWLDPYLPAQYRAFPTPQQQSGSVTITTITNTAVRTIQTATTKFLTLMRGLV